MALNEDARREGHSEEESEEGSEEDEEDSEEESEEDEEEGSSEDSYDYGFAGETADRLQLFVLIIVFKASAFNSHR